MRWRIELPDGSFTNEVPFNGTAAHLTQAGTVQVRFPAANNYNDGVVAGHATLWKE